MKDKKIIDAIGDIDSDLIMEAAVYRPKLATQIRIVAVAACITIILSLACVALVLNINDDRNDVPFDTTKQSQEEENDSIPSQEKTVVYYDCASGSSGAPLYDEVSKYLVSENVSFESFDSLKLEALSGEISDPDITGAKIQRAFEFLQANIASEVLTAIQDSTDVVVNHNGDYYLKVNVSFKYTSDIAVVFYINLSDFQ